MLGKRSSLKVLLSRLKNYQVTRTLFRVIMCLSHVLSVPVVQVPVVTSTEFVQGKTWRWGVAWSFNTDLKDRVIK